MQNRNAAPRPRRRRSEEITRALAAARARNLDQTDAVRDGERAEQQRREQRLRDQQREIDHALAAYMDASAAIIAAEHTTTATIGELETAIQRARDRLRADTNKHRQSQADAAYRIRCAGRRIPEIAVLLDIGRGKAAQLVTAGRASARDDEPTAALTDPVAPPAPTAAPAPPASAAQVAAPLPQPDVVDSSPDAARAETPKPTARQGAAGEEPSAVDRESVDAASDASLAEVGHDTQQQRREDPRGAARPR